MTFWHYHWALLRARELELRTAIAFPFAHMAQLATPDGACSYSIASMAADLGLDRRDFGRAVRELWKRGALYAAGKSSRGRSATVYRLVPEHEARAVVEAWRAARRQPGPQPRMRGNRGQAPRFGRINRGPQPRSTGNRGPRPRINRGPQPRILPSHRQASKAIGRACGLTSQPGPIAPVRRLNRGPQPRNRGPQPHTTSLQF